MAPKDVIEVLQDRYNIPYVLIKYFVFPLLYENTNKIVKRNKRNWKQCIKQVKMFERFRNQRERCIDEGEYRIVKTNVMFNGCPLDRLVWVRPRVYVSYWDIEGVTSAVDRCNRQWEQIKRR